MMQVIISIGVALVLISILALLWVYLKTMHELTREVSVGFQKTEKLLEETENLIKETNLSIKIAEAHNTENDI